MVNKGNIVDSIRIAKDWILIGIGWVLLLLSFFVSSPTVANARFVSRYYIFYGITFAAVVTALVVMYRRQTLFSFKLQDFLLILFVSYVLVRNVFMTVCREEQMLFWICICCLYFVFRQMTLVTNIRISLFCIIGLGILEIFWGLGQLYGLIDSNHISYKLTGSFLNPGPYSGFLAVVFPLALYFFMQEKAWCWQKIVAGCCMVLLLTILPAGLSRSSWIALGVGGLFVCHDRLIGGWKKYIRRGGKSVILQVVILGILLSAICCGMYVMKKDSADGRLLIWKLEWRIVQEHLWMGVGNGGFPAAIGTAQADWFAGDKATAQDRWVAGIPEYGFNEFLQLTVENGIFGLGLFLALVTVAFRNAIRKRRFGIIGALIALFVFSCFSYPFRVLPLCILFVWLLALCAVDIPENNRVGVQSGKKQLAGRSVFFLILLVPLVWGMPLQEKKRQAYIIWSGEKSFFDMGMYKITVDNYRKLYSCLKDRPEFLFEYGQCLAKTGYYEESNRILYEGTKRSADPMFYNVIGKNYQAMNKYQEAEKAFRHASWMVPNRLYPLYLLAGLYLDTGQTFRGLALIEEIMDKKPKVMSSAVREMKAELSARRAVVLKAADQ